VLLPPITPQEFIAFAIAEGLRNDNTDTARRLYPGGPFDPLGFSKNAAVSALPWCSLCITPVHVVPMVVPALGVWLESIQLQK
jgi:hypothetical protein